MSQVYINFQLHSQLPNDDITWLAVVEVPHVDISLEIENVKLRSLVHSCTTSDEARERSLSKKEILKRHATKQLGTIAVLRTNRRKLMI